MKSPHFSAALAALSLSCLLGAKGCHQSVWVETDRNTYEVGDNGTAILHNDTLETVYLPGCAIFAYEKMEAGTWVDRGPSEVCVWEGTVSPVPSGGMGTKVFRVTEPGQWRLRYAVGFGCQEGKPMSQAGCRSIESLHTQPFSVNEEEQQACGSRGLDPCPPDAYCDWDPVDDPSACGADDHPGVCRQMPHACDDVAEPVCGCDGRDYGNPCRAAQHAVDVAYMGSCNSSGQGEACGADAPCRDGLVCCYPCGIPGCTNVCMVPCNEAEPGCGGGCPMPPRPPS